MAANTCSRHTFFLGRRKWLHMYMPKQRALNLDRWRDSLSRIVPDPSMLKQHFFSSLVNSPRVRSMAAYRRWDRVQKHEELSIAALSLSRCDACLACVDPPTGTTFSSRTGSCSALSIVDQDPQVFWEVASANERPQCILMAQITATDRSSKLAATTVLAGRPNNTSNEKPGSSTQLLISSSRHRLLARNTHKIAQARLNCLRVRNLLVALHLKEGCVVLVLMGR